MKAKHRFYKYRTLHSAGPSSWQITRLSNGETPKSFFEEMGQAHNWSEHFRGIEWKKIKYPPRDWLEKQAASLMEEANSMLELVEDYMEILGTLPP